MSFPLQSVGFEIQNDCQASSPQGEIRLRGNKKYGHERLQFRLWESLSKRHRMALCTHEKNTIVSTRPFVPE